MPIFHTCFQGSFYSTNSLLLYDIIQHPINRQGTGEGEENMEGSRLRRNIGRDGIVHMIFFASGNLHGVNWDLGGVGHLRLKCLEQTIGWEIYQTEVVRKRTGMVAVKA